MPKSITRKLPLSMIKQVEGFEYLTDEHSRIKFEF
jgi:hypothetical protein